MLAEIAAALATALTEGVAVDELQVVPRYMLNPTGPSIDVYPANPSQEDSAFGRWPRLTLWTVRARVGVADHDANQDLLLQLLEPGGPTSVRAAIMDDLTLGGLAEGMDVESPSGYLAYTAVDGTGGYIGCEWRVRIYATGGDV